MFFDEEIFSAWTCDRCKYKQKPVEESEYNDRVYNRDEFSLARGSNSLCGYCNHELDKRLSRTVRRFMTSNNNIFMDRISKIRY